MSYSSPSKRTGTPVKAGNNTLSPTFSVRPLPSIPAPIATTSADGFSSFCFDADSGMKTDPTFFGACSTLTRLTRTRSNSGINLRRPLEDYVVRT